MMFALGLYALIVLALSQLIVLANEEQDIGVRIINLIFSLPITYYVFYTLFLQ